MALFYGIKQGYFEISVQTPPILLTVASGLHIHPASLKIKTTEATQSGNPRSSDSESDHNVGHSAGQTCQPATHTH
jgi:hypothetical protein